ncbi:hypothetical protein L7F22_050614 [Adiantum nelumboides]|nr:hypothetical protein [Adiantum nelumboides]
MVKVMDDVFEADQFVEDLDLAYQQVQQAIQNAQEKHKKYADKHECRLHFREGDWVLLRFEKARLRKQKGEEKFYPKLRMRYYGPFQISEVINDVSYRLSLPASWKIHNTFHVSLLRQFVGELPDQPEDSPQPEVDELDEVLQPEQILANKERCQGGRMVRRYLVKFKNYSAMESKWMEEADLADTPQILELYLEAFSVQPTIVGAQTGISVNASTSKLKGCMVHCNLVASCGEIRSSSLPVSKRMVKLWPLAEPYDTSKKRSQHLNIDKAAAAKGKVDFVKVESWGDEEKDQRDLDNLKVKSFSPSFSSRDTTGSFYERLVHRIQLLESKGEISVVHAKSLPRFEDWTFRDATYLQYLVDQYAVFDALRTSIANISEQESKRTLFNENKFAAAVKIFDETLGLERSQALQDDITAFSNTIGFVYKKIVEVPKPTTQTTAYVKYLRQLAGVSGASKPEKEGYLRLLAHIFAVYVAHLTTGMRIGTKALDCLTMLKHSKAVRFYRFYPQNIRDPLKVLIQAINRVAYLVAADDDQETIMEELPKAIQKTSLLLAILAVQEKK